MQRRRTQKAFTVTKGIGIPAIKDAKELRPNNTKKPIKEIKKGDLEPMTPKLVTKKNSQKQLQKRILPQTFNTRRKSMASIPREPIHFLVSPIVSHQTSDSQVCSDETLEMLIKDIPF